MEYHLLYFGFPAFPAHSSLHLLGDPSEENFLVVLAKEALIINASCVHVTHHLTLGVEAIDPYITTQVNVIHTIARRMDDENKTPPS